MQSLRTLKSRLKAAHNLQGITKAMGLVAATKMRVAQERALGGRYFAFAGLSLLREFQRRLEQKPRHSFFEERANIPRALLIVVAADRGLAGSLNGNVFRQAMKQINNLKQQGIQIDVAAIGKKAEEFLIRRRYPPVASFTKFAGVLDLQESLELADFLMQAYERKRYGRIMIISTHFRSTLKQIVFTRQLLPLRIETINEVIEGMIPETGKWGQLRNEPLPSYSFSYLIEPSREKVFNDLIPLLFRVMVHQLVLEANASEHSARMVAMKNASDNAKEISEKLSLQYNKLRQARITNEMIEISSGISGQSA